MPLFFAHLPLVASKKLDTKLAKEAPRSNNDDAGSCANKNTHSRARVRVRSLRSVVFPSYLENRSFCAAVYQITPADSQWLTAVAQQLRQVFPPRCIMDSSPKSPSSALPHHSDGRTDVQNGAIPIERKVSHLKNVTPLSYMTAERLEAQQRRLLQWDNTDDKGHLAISITDVSRIPTEELHSERNAEEKQRIARGKQNPTDDDVDLPSCCTTTFLPSSFIQFRPSSVHGAGKFGELNESVHGAASDQSDLTPLCTHRYRTCIALPAVESVLPQWCTLWNAPKITRRTISRCEAENDQNEQFCASRLLNPEVYSCSAPNPQEGNKGVHAFAAMKHPQIVVGGEEDLSSASSALQIHQGKNERVQCEKDGNRVVLFNTEDSTANVCSASRERNRPNRFCSESPMNPVRAALVKPAGVPSATIAVPQRCFVDMNVYASAMSWKRKQNRISDLVGQERADLRSWWAWWCRSAWPKGEDDMHTKASSKEAFRNAGDAVVTSVTTYANIPAESWCSDRGHEGVRWLRGPLYGQLCDTDEEQDSSAISATLLNARVHGNDEDDSDQQRVSALPMTQTSVNKMWGSIRQSLFAETCCEQKERAEYARRECIAATETLNMDTRAADVLYLMQRRASFRTNSHQPCKKHSLNDYPTLSCWCGVPSFTLAKHRELLWSFPLVSAQISGGDTAKAQTPSELIEVVRSLAYPRWRSASLLPWDSWIAAICSATRLPLLLPSSKSALWWVDSAAQPAQLFSDFIGRFTQESSVAFLKMRKSVGDVFTFSANEVVEQSKLLLQSSELFSSHALLQPYAACSICAKAQNGLARSESKGHSHAFAGPDDRHFCSDGIERSLVASLSSVETEKSSPFRCQPRCTHRKRYRSEELRKAGSSNTLSLSLYSASSSPTISTVDRRNAYYSDTEADADFCAAAFTRLSAPQQTELMVLGGDALSSSDRVVALAETKHLTREENRQALMKFFAKREAAAEQRRGERVRRAILFSLLPSQHHLCSTRCDRGGKNDFWGEGNSASHRMYLACVEAWCGGFQHIHHDDGAGVDGSDSSVNKDNAKNGESHRVIDHPLIPLPSAVQFGILRHFVILPPSDVVLSSFSVISRRILTECREKALHTVVASCSASVPQSTDNIPIQNSEVNQGVVQSNNTVEMVSTKAVTQLACSQKNNQLRHELLVYAMQTGEEGRGEQISFRIRSQPAHTMPWISDNKLLTSSRYTTHSGATNKTSPNEEQHISKNVGRYRADTAYAFLSTHWPLFTLRNFAADRLKRAFRANNNTTPVCLQATNTMAHRGTPDVLFNEASSRRADRTTLPFLSVDRVRARRHARYRVYRYAFLRHIFTDVVVHTLSPGTLTASATDTERSFFITVATSVKCQRSRCELVHDDVAKLDLYVSSFLVEVIAEACKRDFAPFSIESAKRADGDADVDESNSTNVWQVERDNFRGNAKSVKKNNLPMMRCEATRRVAAPFLPPGLCVSDIDCTTEFYGHLLHSLLVNGMRRDGWLLFHTHWYDALTGCLSPLSAVPLRPRSAREGMLKVKNRSDKNANEEQLLFDRVDLAKKEQLHNASWDSHDAAGFEMRWFVDSDDEEETINVVEASLFTWYPCATALRNETNRLAQQASSFSSDHLMHMNTECESRELFPPPFVRDVAASTRFLFFYIKGDFYGEEEAEFTTAASRNDGENNESFYRLLRQNAAQLLSGSYWYSRNNIAVANHSTHLNPQDASVREMEREVQPLRRRRYTRHVFSLDEERRWLLTERKAEWETRRMAAFLSQSSHFCFRPGDESAHVTEVENTTYLNAKESGIDAQSSQALLDADNNELDETIEQSWLEMRRQVHLQHMRTPAGPLWPRGNLKSVLFFPFLEARWTDASVHYTFMQYMLRDRRANLGSLVEPAF